jgi:hypothetical protein
MLRRRGWLALAVLAVAVAAGHGWLIGRLAPEPPATPPASAVVVVAEPPGAADAPAAPEPAQAPEAAPPVEPPMPPRAVPKRAAAPRTAPSAASAAAPAPIEPTVSVAEAPASDGGAGDDTPPAPLAAALLPVAAAAALPAPPVYRTRVPASTKLVYRLSRGLIAGTGELDWRQDGGSYQLKLEAKLPLIGTLITQTSRGRIDASGLAPERHTDRRIRRSELAANFQRAQGRVSFSGGAAEQPLLPGMQDRLSVMVQLAAVAAAGAQPPPAGHTVRIAVVGARGDAAVWVLRFEGVQTVALPDGAVSAWHYRREPDSPHDTRAEYWLDPARGHLPLRVRLTDGSAEPLELLRQSP